LKGSYLLGKKKTWKSSQCILWQGIPHCEIRAHN
jgi:hypothetical protein